MLGNINLKNGVIIYNDFYLNDKISLEEQIDFLKEDMLQIQFSKDYLLDIGWYPEFDENGSFKIVIVKNFDWSNLLFKKECKNLVELKKYIDEAVSVLENI